MRTAMMKLGSPQQRAQEHKVRTAGLVVGVVVAVLVVGISWGVSFANHSRAGGRIDAGVPALVVPVSPP